jgi:hypothetical protein
MKEVAILLLLAVMLNGCGNSTAVQAPSGSVWQSVMAGGVGSSSGFSFNTQFAGSNGSFTASSFELLNADTCYGNLPSNVIIATGMLMTTYNSADQVTGNFSFRIPSPAGDVINLTSTSVTGTVNPNNNYVLSGASIIGNWTLSPGSGSPCVAASGSFTMTQTGT